MKKILTILSISVLAAGVSLSAIAQEPEQKQKRVEHYSVTIETKTAAFKALDEKIPAIADILKNKDILEFSEFEAIHKITYTLEAAVDKLRIENAVAANKLDAIDEAVQAIHFSSEKKKEAIVREWFEKINIAVNDISNKTNDEVVEKKEFYEIFIKDNKFTPETITVPVGQKIKLIVHNQDPTPEEFESHDLNREKIILGNRKATIFIGPLKAGKYHYFGEFNMDSANGYIIAK